MWDRPDSQEVGPEAAILERVRNSSLVEWSRADNVSGLKPGAEAADAPHPGGARGRGASDLPRSPLGMAGGGDPSANAGMSSARGVRSAPPEWPRVPIAGSSRSGQSGLSRGRRA